VTVGSERNDPVELAVEERVARDNQRAKVLNDDGRECIFEIAFSGWSQTSRFCCAPIAGPGDTQVRLPQNRA
jgi:hypothetical protein